MTREERISTYEGILDRAQAAAEQMEAALQAFAGMQEDVKALETYYTGNTWKEDYDADARGLLPAQFKRGVLSEDGVYNLLETYRELKEEMRHLSRA